MYYRAMEQEWNAIDSDLRAINDHLIFKIRLKAYFLEIRQSSLYLNLYTCDNVWCSEFDNE